MRFAILIDGMEPAPQGSKTLTRYGTMIETCRRVGVWRALVKKEAKAVCNAMLTGPCRVSVEFRFRRPLADYTSTGEIKPKAPIFYTKRKNDIDKITRSTLDALTGVAFKDDCQVVSLQAERRYVREGERPGAFVIVEQVWS